MKMMMKSAFVKSNVKLMATILIVLLLLLKVVKQNSELDQNHPTLIKQDMRRFSSLKYEQSFPWLYYSCIKSRLTQRNLETLMRISKERTNRQIVILTH